ncbi:MAG: lipopolysaccharide biosynthesis protein [Acidimicrobiia bacterium]
MDIVGTEREPLPRSPSGGDHSMSRSTGLSRKASLNAAAAGLDFGARTIVELVLNPLLLHGLGDYLYGAWRILWRLTGYLWATSGRAAQALQSAIANRLHSEDTDEKRRLVGASVVVWAFYLPLLSTVTALAIWKLPGLLDAPSRHVTTLRWTILLLGVDSINVSLLTIPQSTLQGENLGYRRMGLSTVLVLLSGLLTAGALWLDFSIIGVAVVNMIATLYTGAVFWRITKTHVPWFGLARPRRDEVRWFFGLSSWFMMWKLVNQLMMSGDVLVLGVLGSVELVGIYSLTKFIPEATLPLLSMLVMGGIPGLGGIIGAGDHPRARRVRGEVLALTWLLALAGAVAILVWNESFVALWVGERYFAGTTELLLLMITLVQLALIRSDAFIIDLTLKVRAKTLTGLGSSLVALVTAGVLIREYDMGITGLCIGLVAGRSILNVIYPVLIGKAIEHPFRDQLVSAVRPVLATVGMFAAAVALGRHVSVDSWPVLIVGSALTGVAALAIAFSLGLDPGARHRVAKRVRLLAGRSRR